MRRVGGNRHARRCSSGFRSKTPGSVRAVSRRRRARRGAGPRSRRAAARRPRRRPGPAPRRPVDSAPQATAAAQALLGRLAHVAGGDVAGQERVARAARTTTASRGSIHTRWQTRSPSTLQAGDAAVGQRHDRLAGAQRDHLADRRDAVLLVVELVADELLGLDDVRARSRRARRGRPGASGSPSESTIVVTPICAQLARSASRRCRSGRRAAASRRRRRCRRRGPGRAACRGTARPRRRVTAGPRSLISVCSPLVGS